VRDRTLSSRAVFIGGFVDRGTFASKGSLAVLAIVAFLAAELLTTLPLQAAESVSGLELRRLFPGRFQVVAHGFLKIRIIASADGSLYARQIGKSDTGVWAIRADQLCIRFTKWLKGRTRCSTVTEQAGWYSTSDVTFKKVTD
jgi:hypothetical protein